MSEGEATVDALSPEPKRGLSVSRLIGAKPGAHTRDTFSFAFRITNMFTASLRENSPEAPLFVWTNVPSIRNNPALELSE